MRIEIDTRRVVPIAAAVLIVVVAITVFVWRMRARAEARAVVSWSGTISSGAPTSTPESPTAPVVTVEYGQTDLTAELNEYWLAKINALRTERGVHALRLDERLAVTAGEWATEMASRREITHRRMDGKTMHQWIDTKGLPFAERGGENGWETNYFVENIARFYAEPTTEDMQRALDEALAWFLAEGPGGDHYESIYHQDWNSVGIGYAFDPTEKQRRVYLVFHYGRLQ